MIHKAARDMVLERHGAQAWASILAKSGLSSDHFISAESYPDATTYRLIGAIVEAVGGAPEQVLEDFGRHWVKFAENSQFASLLQRAGDDLPTFLSNLDRMHSSIKSTLPSAVMPSFDIRKSDADEMEIVYRSERRGLLPFVRGILYGLLDMFRLRGRVTSEACDGGGLFRIRLDHV